MKIEEDIVQGSRGIYTVQTLSRPLLSVRNAHGTEGKYTSAALRHVDVYENRTNITK